MSKIIKIYEDFKYTKDFKFEDTIIDPILSCIRDNQEYLTQPENLPQLAKLGYMYNTLWYSGRVCWGYGGILRGSIKPTDEDGETYGDCENNPKYKIEMCNPQNDEIEGLIYSAWGMHVTMGNDPISFSDFNKIIKDGKVLSSLEKKKLKLNKTFDDWVDIFTDPEYRYHKSYPNRKSVSENLLCVIGNGYEWNKDGFICERNGSSLYGDWENAKFRDDIQVLVNTIMDTPEVKLTLDSNKKYIEEEIEKRKAKEKKSMFSSLNDISDDELDELLYSARKLRSEGSTTVEPKEKYNKYYPISSSSAIYLIMSDEARKREKIDKIHQSYIDEAISICKDIMAHESQEEKGNVKFAIKLLANYGFEEYQKLVPKEIDKYALKSQIEDALLYITDEFTLVDDSSSNSLNKGEYIFYLSDTKDNRYADNCYYFYFSLKGFNIPKGYSNSLDYVNGLPFYNDLKSTLNRISHLKGIKQMSIYVENVESSFLYIKFDPKSTDTDQIVFENDLVKDGFQVGLNSIALEVGNFIFTCRKPIVLGSSHPNNKTGREIFTNALQVGVFTNDWVPKGNFNMDERGYNTLTANLHDKTINNWIVTEFKRMKDSDKDYGTYNSESRTGKEGSRKLLAHDFFLWLKENKMK